MLTVPRLSLLVLLALLVASCSSTRVGSATRSTNSAKTLTASEWDTFATEIIDQVNATGVISRYYQKNGGEPVVLAIGQFDNKVASMSQSSFSRTKDIMYASIRQALVNGTGGMVSVNMDVGNSTDEVLQDLSQLRGSSEYDQTTVTGPGRAQAPDLVLNGAIVTVEYEEGRTTRYDYATNVRLIDTETRGTVFEKQIIFPKEMQRGLFGL